MGVAHAGLIAMQKPTKQRIKSSQFPIREDKAYRIEVHVAGVCIREGGDGVSPEILIAKRNPKRELFPNKWECGGGQVRPGESFEEAIRRQMYEEFNLSVDVLAVIGTYQIPRSRLQEVKIPGLSFLCIVKGKGAEATLNEREHSKYRWIRQFDVKKYEFIGGVAKDIHRALAMLPPLPKSSSGKIRGFAQ
jgi:8-oxo-dGTP pyrophosphatase MutT (NUDIX family)